MIKKIIAIMAKVKSVELPGNGSNWIIMAPLGAQLKEAGINLKKMGFRNLKSFFEAHPESFELHQDPCSPLTHYVRIKQNADASSNQKKTQSERYVVAKNGVAQNNNRPEVKRTNSRGNREIRKFNFTPIEDFAFFPGGIDKFLMDLSAIALSELWSYFKNNPKYPPLLILFLFIRYTFCRLQYQNKIAYSIDGKWAAFNTGLTDDRWEPIIALFKKNRADSLSEWYFDGFVFQGEGRGKILSSLFEGEIQAATYTENPVDLIYDSNLGAPSIDYDHIILDRVGRLPEELIRMNCPHGFVVKSTKNMLKSEKNSYLAALREAIKNDAACYRRLINRLKEAVSLAVKRVQWNHNTAVPMFYPKENRVCLLLPLCLVDDTHEDLALVVTLTPARKYAGVTILPLDLAYADSRVVARHNSEWLSPENIICSGETIF